MSNKSPQNLNQNVHLGVTEHETVLKQPHENVSLFIGSSYTVSPLASLFVQTYNPLLNSMKRLEGEGGRGGGKKSEGKPELTATLYGLHLVNTQFSGSAPISQITQSH